MSKNFVLERSSALVPTSERERILQSPGWGKVFSDHMITMRYSEGRGWFDGKIEATADLKLHPGTMVLHYAAEIFEGLKAYSLPDGGATLFRPDANARRFRASAERLAMAQLPENVFVESVKELVSVERDWISKAEGASLYLRPFMLGSEVALGTKPSPDFIYCVVASPVEDYFSSGSKPVSLWVSEQYTRAAPGGTGAAKCGGNYAAAVVAQAEGLREGCEQVVFLDAVERRWVEELGGMNIFFVFEDGSMVTPPLTGTILPGVTRDSLITLARELGHKVSEEPYSIDQWQADAKSGRLTESFACGTAAVITPIGQVKGKSYNFTIGSGGDGEITRRLKRALTDIQYGRAHDKHGWLSRVF